jgi:hypothetical protein
MVDSLASRTSRFPILYMRRNLRRIRLKRAREWRMFNDSFCRRGAIARQPEISRSVTKRQASYCSVTLGFTSQLSGNRVIQALRDPARPASRGNFCSGLDLHPAAGRKRPPANWGYPEDGGAFDPSTEQYRLSGPVHGELIVDILTVIALFLLARYVHAEHEVNATAHNARNARWDRY